MSPAAQAALVRLDQVRQRWWVYSFFSRIILSVAVSLLVLAAFISADALLQLHQGWLGALFCLWALASLLLLSWTFRLGLNGQRNVMAAARRIEQAFPELDSHLINLVQLAGTSDQGPSAFREVAVNDAADRVARAKIDQAATRHSRRARWQLGLQSPRDLAEAGVVLLAATLVALMLNTAVPTWSSSVHRLFAPWQFVPQVGSVKILEVTPGDSTVLVGGRLDISARIDPPVGAKDLNATLETWTGGHESEPKRRAMLAGDNPNRFTCVVPAVMKPLQYRLQVGDSQSQVFHVEVARKPTINEVDVTYHYPDYLNRDPHGVTQKHADLKAPQFTEAVLTVHCSTPLESGSALLAEHEIPGIIAGDGRTLALRFTLARSAAYTIELVSRQGHANDTPRVNSIQVVEDAPPSVSIVKPSRDATVSSDGRLPVVVRATDDHGLEKAWLQWKTADDSSKESDPRVVHQWKDIGGSKAATEKYTLVEPFQEVNAGEAVLVRAVVEDGRRVDTKNLSLKPQRGTSVWRRIELVDDEALLSEQLDRIESWRTALWTVLQMQMRTRAKTALLALKEDRESGRELAGSIREKQVPIQRKTASLAESIAADSDSETTALKQTLVDLANNELQNAVSLAEKLVRLGQLGPGEAVVEELATTQDAVIKTLQRLLQFTRRASTKALAEMEKRPGGDLPDDVKDKLQDLRDKLEEFSKQQKRVIEATKNLAKKPVEDFTQEDEQLLRDLAATEDEWSRFMEEMHSDFSKLPEQDFANPSMLEEFIEIQTELKMAADALTKKTADVAVPLEQLGAEMAEEMTTNIEKWLPDTPDRERWSQEEPLTDAMKEAPMAELPGELEDLVGELMEEEEDLMDEMEDRSSSWADSLDKGAGWDAADGPISNMSARGVTGNRLPNSSEIGGRSGEGRQGKASGEFVGDTAVGKGGRKTPSRLAPDPFVEGQVKDVSKDPVGGATGGGKESGAGGEGLEGPLRQRVRRDMKRLAKKQADLRNRAEAIDLKFKVLNYHHEDLHGLIDTMASVERDLRGGRYRSALRRKQVLLGELEHVKSYAEGEVEVRHDRSSNLPSDIQKDILASMQEASPEGWEQLNRRYFQRLATEDDAGTAGQADPSTSAP
ncbi:MAG: hypothetical protein ACODAD_11195 [Planctomycetota bacterium]